VHFCACYVGKRRDVIVPNHSLREISGQQNPDDHIERQKKDVKQDKANDAKQNGQAVCNNELTDAIELKPCLLPPSVAPSASAPSWLRPIWYLVGHSRCSCLARGEATREALLISPFQTAGIWINYWS